MSSPTTSVDRRSAPAGSVTGFFHAGVTVLDLERSLRFYRDLLRLPVRSLRRFDQEYPLKIAGVMSGGLTVALLGVPGSDAVIELLEYREVERHSASCRPCDHGAGHFCLWVDDLDALHDRLHAAGYHTRTERPIDIPVGPRKGGKASYAIDPDGYHIELFEPPAASGRLGS